MVDQKEVELRKEDGEWVTPTQEVPKREEQNLEVESWITKIEKRFARVPKGAPGPQDDAVVVTQPQSQQPPVTLPIKQQQLNDYKKAKPELSIAWLVAWAIRQIKMLTKLGRKVRLQDIPEVSEEGKKNAGT